MDDELSFLRLQNMMLQAENRRLKAEIDNIKNGFISIDLGSTETSPVFLLEYDIEFEEDFDNFKDKNEIYISIKEKIRYAYKALTGENKTYNQIKLYYKDKMQGESSNYKLYNLILEDYKNKWGRLWHRNLQKKIFYALKMKIY